MRNDESLEMIPITYGTYIKDHIKMLEPLQDVPMARAMLNVLRECLRSNREGLGVLIVMAMLADIHKRQEEAIDAWTHLSRELGTPRVVIREK